MATNIYTTQFYTQVQTNTLINQTASSINLSVDSKLSNYSTTTEMNSAINLTNNAITAEVSRASTAEATLSSRIQQTAKGITLSVNNGDVSSGITITTTKEDGTTATTTGTIQMNGLVTFTGLSSGTTTVNGACITTGTIKGVNLQSTNYSANSQGTLINLSTGAIDTRYFKVSSTGNITATGGTIGGFTIGTNKIYNTKTTLSDTEHNGVYIGTDGISLGTGSTFKVTNAGALTCSNVTLTGGIIKSNNYVSGTSGTLLNLSNGAIDSAHFKVNSAGGLTADSAIISGQITAKSGYIGNGSSGWTIGNTSIYNSKSSLTANANGVYIGTDGISLGTGSTFKVTNTGALTATSATISGNITATTGTFDNCTIRNTCTVPASTVSGTLASNNIPNLSASKITSGTMSADRISGGTISGVSVNAFSLFTDGSCEATNFTCNNGSYWYGNSSGASIGSMWVITGWTSAGGGAITFKGRNVTFKGGIITSIGSETTATAYIT